MTLFTLFGLCAALLVGLGLYGLIVNPHPLRKILAFNVVGSGVFLLFGAIAYRGAGAGMGGDPVPQALLITGIVVAFSATALAVALLLRLFDETGSVTLSTATGAAGGSNDSLSAATTVWIRWSTSWRQRVEVNQAHPLSRFTAKQPPAETGWSGNRSLGLRCCLILETGR